MRIIAFLSVLFVATFMTFSAVQAASYRDGFALEINYSALETGKKIPGKVHHDYPRARESDFAYYNAIGIRHIRLPVRWERLQPELRAPLNRAYLADIRDALKKARRNGLTVTLDVHNYGGYRGKKIGGGEVTNADFANLWSRLATEFKDEPVITVYDLMNEPSKMPSKDVWPAAAQSAIDAIRIVDREKTIMVEGNGFSAAFHWERNNPGLHKLHDISDKLIFSAHVYLDRNNSGTHFSWEEEVATGDHLTHPKSALNTDIGVKRVTPFVEWLKKHNLRGNIGEIGVSGDHPGWLSALDNTLAYLKANDVSVTYWNAGPWYGDYPYAVNSKSGEERSPQWDILTKYINPAR